MCHSGLYSRYFHIENDNVVQPHDLLVVSKKQLVWERPNEYLKDYKERILNNVTVYTIPLGEGGRLLFRYYNEELYPKRGSGGRWKGECGLKKLAVDCYYFTDTANRCR